VGHGNEPGRPCGWLPRKLNAVFSVGSTSPLDFGWSPTTWSRSHACHLSVHRRLPLLPSMRTRLPRAVLRRTSHDYQRLDFDLPFLHGPGRAGEASRLSLDVGVRWRARLSGVNSRRVDPPLACRHEQGRRAVSISRRTRIAVLQVHVFSLPLLSPTAPSVPLEPERRDRIFGRDAAQSRVEISVFLPGRGKVLHPCQALAKLRIIRASSGRCGRLCSQAG